MTLAPSRGGQQTGLMVDRLTLDTDVIRRWFDQDARVEAVRELIELSDRGLIELAVTATVHQDVPRPPLSDRLSELPELGIAENGTVARLGSWVLGRDGLGSQGFVDWVVALGVEEPDWRDFDHLHAHMLLGRDYFLTWDSNIHHFAEDLSILWGIEVRRPEEYLAERQGR